MPFFPIDVLLSGLATLLIAGSAFASGYVAYGLPFVVDSFRALASLLGLLLGLLIMSCILGRVIWRMYPIGPGLFRLDVPNRSASIWKVLGYLNLYNVSLFVHTGLLPVTLRWVVYSLVGAKIGKNVMIGGKIVEPLMVSVGNLSILGEDCLVLGHVISRGVVTLGRVDIGNNVTIGAKATVMPDVVVGDGAVVWAGALVARGSRIGPGEEWAGVPARAVRTRS